MDRAIIDQRQVSATEERAVLSNVWAVAPGVWRMKDVFVNVFLIQDNDNMDFVLVDTGLKSSAAKIKKMISTVIGDGSLPSSIIMTHGHFDHRGSVEQLANEWQVPVYCHHMETPYLSGRASYPPADPTVGGGIMAYSSFLYPKKPIDLQDRLRELPENGAVPGLAGWRWVHTPGHTPGHISLFRKADGVLIAGDAIVSTKQESAYAVMTQVEVLSGPPKYFTPDWGAAARSVKMLAEMEPNVIATGHGHSLYGDEARKALHKLSRNFWKQAMPLKGRYVKEPALFNEEGPTYVPPAKNNAVYLRLATAVLLVVAGIYFYSKKKKGGLTGKLNEKLGKSLLKSAPKALALPNAAPAM
jgi:glyoxylase-like metal-dependent hydrolase (beta-lactamase superfamily II)